MQAIDILKIAAFGSGSSGGGGGDTPTGSKTITVTRNGRKTEDVAAFASALIDTAVDFIQYPSRSLTKSEFAALKASTAPAGTFVPTDSTTTHEGDIVLIYGAISDMSSADGQTVSYYIAGTVTETANRISIAAIGSDCIGRDAPEGTYSITANGTFDVSDYANASVNVPGPSGTYNVTQNGTFDITNYSSVVVAVPGPSGSVTLNTNGTHDVTNYASAVVDVPQPAGSITITENGTVDVTNYASAVVNVSGGGGDSLTDALSTGGLAEWNSSVTKLAMNAFYDSSTSKCNFAIKKVTLNAITNIPLNAFRSMTALQEFHSTSLKTVGSSAFYSCSGLTTFDAPAVTSFAYGALEMCSSLTEYTGPNVETIDANVFSSCSALKNVVLSNVETLGDTVFISCRSLETVDLGDKLVSIGAKVFQMCSGLKAVVIRRTDAVASSGSLPLYNASGNAKIYVPAALVASYKAATNWASFASQIAALEDITVDGTTTGSIDPTKI